MSLVTGIGGVFLKSRNPTDLARWYRDVLGVEQTVEGRFGWLNRLTPV